MKGIDLVASTSDIGFVTDCDGTILAWNEAAEEALGIASDEALGEHCWEVLQGRDVFGNDYCGPHCPIRQMAFAGKRTRRCQLFFTDTNDESSCYSVATLVLRFTDPRETAIIHLLHPAFWDRRRKDVRVTAEPNGNRARGELTVREREVLAELVAGHGTAEVARVLRISEKTARNHIQSILHRLRVHSRVEAVAVARRAHLV